jgi:hypothetical protein
MHLVPAQLSLVGILQDGRGCAARPMGAGHAHCTQDAALKMRFAIRLAKSHMAAIRLIPVPGCANSVARPEIDH